MKSYLQNLIISMSQLINVIFRGKPDETLSARAWREQKKLLIVMINSFFFWQNNHCRGAYDQEIGRKHQHAEYLNTKTL